MLLMTSLCSDCTHNQQGMSPAATTRPGLLQKTLHSASSDENAQGQRFTIEEREKVETNLDLLGPEPVVAGPLLLHKLV
jgi:hypothetical protein